MHSGLEYQKQSGYHAEIDEYKETLEECMEQSINIEKTDQLYKDDGNSIRTEQTKTKRNEEPKKNNDSGIEIGMINELKTELIKHLDITIKEQINEILITLKLDWPKLDVSLPEENIESKTRSYKNTKIEPRRDQNFIKHGGSEGNHMDADYLNEFFNILEMGHTGPFTRHRLGIRNSDRPRPLKVVMKSVDEKEKLMSNLDLLNKAENKFKRISVTDDYTLEEREEIRRWVTMARNRNTEEGRIMHGKLEDRQRRG